MNTYTAFEGTQMIAQGSLETVALEVKKKTKSNKKTEPLIFSDRSGKQIDLDLSGTDQDTLERLKVYSQKSVPAHTGAGRPKLGVIPREISLLPQHWEWLLNQESSPSGMIRKLIDEKNAAQLRDQVKSSQESTYKFLSAIAGDLPNYEEVIRYLYRKDKKQFQSLMAGWPKDLSKHALALSKPVFEN